MDDNLTLEELAERSELSIRTIRYYIQEGLLWGPDTKGKFATYSQEHLERLGLIEALTKRTHLPLKEIRKLLDHATSDQLEQIQEILADTSGKVVIIDTDQEAEEEQPAEAGKEALEYLDSISWVTPSIKETPAVPQQDTVQDSLDLSGFKQWTNQNWSRTKEEHWQRIILNEGVELHIRVPRDRKADSKTRELLIFARKLFRS